MRLLGYYAWHTFVNSIKKMFKSTFLIIFFSILAIGLVMGLSMGVLFSSMEDEYAEEYTLGDDGNYYDEEGNLVDEYGHLIDENGNLVDEYGRLIDEDGNFIDENGRLIDEDGNLIDENGHLIDENGNIIDEGMGAAEVKILVEAGAALLMIGFLLWGIYAGNKNGSDIFLMADVNLLFTAPLKPQSVLMFRLTFQMAALLFGSIYLLFQIPNLVMNVGLDAYAVAAIFLAWIFLLVLQKLVSVLTYTLTATHEKLKKYVLPLIFVILAVLAAVTGGVFVSTGRDVLQTAEILYASKWSRMIPVIGWYKALIMTAVDGELLASLGYGALLLAGMALFIFFIWRIKADFYEDAMAGAQKRDEIQKAAAEGRKVKTKERSKRIAREGTLKGYGASMFLQKEIYTRRRLAKFGVFTNTMLLYLAVTLLIAVSLRKLTVNGSEVDGFTVVGVVLMGILFFRNFGNPIAQETSKNYLFLVPENPYKKVFYAMAAGTYSCAIDVLPSILVAGILLKENPAKMLLWLATLIVMDFMLSTVGMLIEVLVPSTSLDTVKAMIQMMLKFFMILVIVILFVVGMLLGGVVGGLFVTLLGCLAIGAVIFIIYPSMLHEGVA